MSGAKDIFLDAIDLSPADVAAFVDERCGDDAALRAEVERLLTAHGISEDVFGRAKAPVAGLEPGDRIGPYELVEVIGEGGFAVVWRADQQEPIRRTVALKVLKPGLETRQVVARFEAERQALALMDHPGIAKVLDGGVTDVGRPWFSMELVEGRPITDHCEAEGLDKSARLALFLEVCRAVQHAHQKGVVHRDLKPSNILVTRVDGRAVPKVIDFGIAKAMERSLGPDTALTLEGQFVGTPAYMSPEQVDEALDVDTRADVYALGVLLYELLCSRRPFEDETLRAGGLAEILRIIREVEPPRPSARSARGPRTTSVLARQIRGDLDWIVMRCLEKDRERRYDSAGVLGNEIERHLAGEPVLAGPPDLAYRAAKFAARNRVALVFAATVALVLVAGIVVSLTQLSRARSAERLKEVELQRLAELSSFFESILTGVDPAVARGEDTQLMALILADSADRVGAELAGQPDVEATVRAAMGKAYLSIGDADRAEEQFRLAIELRSVALGPEDPSTLESLQQLGTLLMTEDRHDEAEPLLERAARELPRVLGPADVRALRAEGELATLRRKQGALERSEALHRDLLARWTEHHGAADPAAIKTLNNLASVLEDKGDAAGACTLFQRAVELQRASNGELHPNALISLNNLGGVLADLGRIDDATRTLEEALELKKQVLEEGHPSLVVSYNNVAMMRRSLGQYDESLALFEEAAESVDRSGAAASLNALRLRINHARTLEITGDPESALGAYELCADLALERLGPDHELTLLAESEAGWLLVGLGLPDDAEVFLEGVLERVDGAMPDDLSTRAAARIRAGVARKELGRVEDARTVLQEGLDLLSGPTGSTVPAGEWRRVARQALADL
ncbi:MAG: serine/threonine-protein kinase [Planctomycetota bacterium]